MNQDEKIREDAAIIAEILQGNNQRYSCLIKNYQNAVYSCAWSILQNHTDAADVTQEVFIRFFRHINQFDSSRPLRPYLLAMAANSSKNHIRKKSRLNEVSEIIPEQSDFSHAESRNPVSDIMHSEKLEQIRQFVQDLPDTLRDVCSLFYLSECSCRDVARILDISEGAVKVALHRARKKLLERGIGKWMTQ